MSTILRTKKGYGDFGNLSKNYSNARKGFPCEIAGYILEKIGKKRSYVLDIGCGTGIATEQLREKGVNVIGTDIDAEMIKQAEMNNQYRIEYYVAPAERQPFENKKLDAATAFSAFHWFANKEALGEIRRILKPGGRFFAVNKNKIGDFKKQNKEILKKFIEKNLPDAKKEYDPRKVLEENSFRSVEVMAFPSIEYFSPDEAVEYIQTMSIWNLVLEDKRSEALEMLAEHFKRTMNNGAVDRRFEIGIVSGINA